MSFSCYWKNVRLKRETFLFRQIPQCRFSCYWKNVRLKLAARTRTLSSKMFQLLLKECTIEANEHYQNLPMHHCFSCYWKNVRLKRPATWLICLLHKVSVVIERMYDWSGTVDDETGSISCFSCYWKNVRLKRFYRADARKRQRMYSWSFRL